MANVSFSGNAAARELSAHPAARLAVVERAINEHFDVLTADAVIAAGLDPYWGCGLAIACARSAGIDTTLVQRRVRAIWRARLVSLRRLRALR